MSTVISEMQPLRSLISIVVGAGPACGPCAQEVNRSRSTIRLVGVAGARVSPEKSRAWMAGACASREIRMFGLMGFIFFFEKPACLDGGGARTSGGSCLSGWLGRVYLEKMVCLDGCGAYPRERRVWMAVPAHFKSRISVSGVSLMVLDYSYYVEVAILSNVCGWGTFRTPHPQGA